MMADRRELFHSPTEIPIGENAWGGEGYYRFDVDELPEAIVESWMGSPLHRAWLLHQPLQRSVVTVVITPSGQYASWTFWMSEAEEGPELVQRVAEEWQRETNETVPWLEWLDLNGY